MTADDDTRPAPVEHRLIGIVLAVVAIAALGFALVSQRWLLSPSGGIGFGLRDNHVCYAVDGAAPRCDVESNADFVEARVDSLDPYETEHASRAFPWLGWATTGLLALSELGLVASALLALTRKRPAWPIAASTIALAPAMLAMITGFVFCATKPGEASFVGVAIGFWAFGVGEISAIIAGLLLARPIRPLDVDLTADAINPDDF